MPLSLPQASITSLLQTGLFCSACCVLPIAHRRTHNEMLLNNARANRGTAGRAGGRADVGLLLNHSLLQSARLWEPHASILSSLAPATYTTAGVLTQSLPHSPPLVEAGVFIPYFPSIFIPC